MNSKGRLVTLCNLKSGEKNGKAWESGTMVIKVDDQYNPHIVLSVFGNACVAAKAIPIGAEVEVEWNPGGKEYNGNWYPEMKAWKVTQIGDAPLTSDTPSGNEPLPF